MEFLFDDTWIDRSAGVRRVLGRPVKHHEPVLVGEHSWESHAVHPKCAIFHDPRLGRYRMYYGTQGCGRSAVDSADARRDPTEREAGRPRGYICYAESVDGVHWEKPRLDRFDLDGSKANNILFESGGDSVLWNVLYDADDPDPSRRYKALGFEHGVPRTRLPGANSGLAVSFSSDGFDWQPATLVADTRDLTDADCMLPQRDPLRNKWVAYLRPRTSPKRRFLGYAESDDFVRWTHPRMLLTPDADDSPWTEFYGMAARIVSGWRVGVMWVLENHPDSGWMTNELVYSRHGLEYERAMPREPFLELGSDGEFDSRGLWPAAMVEHDDEIRIYSAARNHTHGSNRTANGEMSRRQTPNDEPQRSGISLARLPWGRFCGLRAERFGEIETNWLTQYSNRGLSIVAEVEPGGHVRAELLDVYGQSLPGWTAERSRLVPAERGTHRVVWGDTGLEASHGQQSPQGAKVDHVIKVRFDLHRATLFGFQLGEANGVTATFT